MLNNDSTIEWKTIRQLIFDKVDTINNIISKDKSENESKIIQLKAELNLLIDDFIYRSQDLNLTTEEYKDELEPLEFGPTGSNEEQSSPANTDVEYPKVDYAIITALYKDEFEEVSKLVNWGKPIKTGTKSYKIGSFIGCPDKQVVAAVPPKTGMVDSAIVATQMLEYFRPNYLLMSGVCGGKKGLNFGDIVLASKIHTFQKGKLSDIKDETGQLIELYDKNEQLLDLKHVYDKNKTQIDICVESFEYESESIDIDPLVKDDVDPVIVKIKDIINEQIREKIHQKIKSEFKVKYKKRLSKMQNEKMKNKISKEFKKKKINIHFEPIACSTMVINKNGFFEGKIQGIDRKIVAVEMESYGVARACKISNYGLTNFVIFKSVMDNLENKTDDEKNFAAYTSAQFLKHLILSEVLE